MNKETYDAAETLADLDAGLFLQQLSKAISDTAIATVMNGDKKKQGKVTVEFVMVRIGDSHQIEVRHSVGYDKPTRRGKATEKYTSITALYVAGDGAVSIVPRSQTDMFLQRQEPADKTSHREA